MNLFISLLILCGLNAQAGQQNDLQTVSSVDLQSYLGKWHEIARIPNSFQDKITQDGSGFSACQNVTAEYELLQNQKIKVTNSCTRFNADGESKLEIALGKARIVDSSTNAKLKVNFTGNVILEQLGIGDGDYWILELGEKDQVGNYTYSLVGAPNRDYGWILSRSEKMDQANIEKLLESFAAKGFDKTKFILTQPD